ncbi:DUF4175 family protein [Nafulsella turpanensis]|uniref:DUF4175 family protein n=1 Tax=Nafulsella turpanensis TaxID=1265690 RepID=UPI00036C5E65|nr:DUF4175 family protein [Nafulsella turpanensis]
MGVPEMSGKDVLQRFSRSWKQRKAVEMVLYTLSVALFAAALFYFLLPRQALAFAVFFVALMLSLVLLYRRSGYSSLTPASSARFINRKVPDLEYSSELFLQNPESLSLPARLQKRRLEGILKGLKLPPPPIKLTKAAGFLLLSLLSAAGLVGFAGAIQVNTYSQQPQVTETFIERPKKAATFAAEVPALTEGKIVVTPPAYIREGDFETTLANVEVPEGSILRWELSFSDSISNVWLSLSGGDSVGFQQDFKGGFHASLNLEKSLLYQINWKDKNGRIGTTSYHRLEAMPDQAPFIQLVKPETYTRNTQAPPFPVEVILEDDYGLSEAYLQLTISSGSGEGVSFKEQQIPFDNFRKGEGRLHLRKTLDPKALGMEMGNELYFHVVALDNHQPNRQQSRSETYFFHWEDTAATSSFEVDGMAMDIMPEYFRSQRQIIIDTEKLITERPALTAEEFEKRSNNLGVDQKLLRLRYGKFLGEEFESGYGQEVLPEEGEEGHEHEGEGTGYHQHEEEQQEKPASAENLLSEFMHAHDTEEGATFYEERIEVKLKAALAEMWESELRLRTLRPKEALPYQYKALNIIKEVQQATRVYVERIGFEPPPLKPVEKRLTGSLEEVQSSFRSSDIPLADTLESVKKVITLLQQEEVTRENLSGEATKHLFGKAGQELAAIVQEQPRADYLESLKVLNQLRTGSLPEKERQRFLLRTLLEVLPDAGFAPQTSDLYRSRLERDFMQKVGGTGE